MPEATWAKLHKDAIEHMQAIADETEDYVYDIMVPLLYELGDPEARLTMYQSMDMQALQQNNPKLWARYSKDALSLQEQKNQQQLSALDELRSEQEKQWSRFSRQIDNPTAFGLRSRGAERPNWDNQGLNAPVPSMGGFS